MTGANLSAADFTDAALGTTTSAITWLKGTDLSGATLTGAAFTGAAFTGAAFTGASLLGADLIGVSGLSSATWANTTCPDGVNSDRTDPGTCIGDLFPGSRTYQWSGTLPGNGAGSSELTGSTVIPAGSTVIMSQASTINGDFSGCYMASFNFQTTAATSPSTAIGVWPPPLSIEMDLFGAFITSVTFTTSGPMQVSGSCTGLDEAYPSVSFDITFTVTPPPPTAYS
jgi:uncharacterized protein YjbI with pentapeptide repeats